MLGLKLNHVSKRGHWMHMGCTANIIIKDIIHIFVSISKNVHILLEQGHCKCWLQHQPTHDMVSHSQAQYWLLRYIGWYHWWYTVMSGIMPHARIQPFNTLGPRQNGHYFPDNIFNCIFLNENVWISVKISLNFVPKGPINNILALVQIMAWCP